MAHALLTTLFGLVIQQAGLHSLKKTTLYHFSIAFSISLTVRCVKAHRAVTTGFRNSCSKLIMKPKSQNYHLPLYGYGISL